MGSCLLHLLPKSLIASTSFDMTEEGQWPTYGTDEEKLYRFRPLLGRTLRFDVKAPHDCHLAFTTAEEETSPMFEIFIGAWENGASAVRFNKSGEVVKVDTPGILTGEDFQEFWVKLTPTGVSVGKGAEWEPFMQCELPEPMVPTHFGYSTGWGSIGWFRFHSERAFKTEDCLTYNFQPFYGDDLVFTVSCGNDAHIALTSGPEKTNPMYEIFIGGWSNQKCAIRLNDDKDQTIVKVDTPDLLCNEGEKTFRILFDEVGLKVFQTDSQEPFMEYAEPNKWKVTHFGFCTGWGACGKWKFGI